MIATNTTTTPINAMDCVEKPATVADLGGGVGLTLIVVDGLVDGVSVTVGVRLLPGWGVVVGSGVAVTTIILGVGVAVGVGVALGPNSPGFS